MDDFGCYKTHLALVQHYECRGQGETERCYEGQGKKKINQLNQVNSSLQDPMTGEIELPSTRRG